MSVSSDNRITIATDKKTRFPLLNIEGFGSLTLWPITKIQFETFMAETGRFGDSWYNEILACNPRISFRHFSSTDYEKLFITGVQTDEAILFSHWFGNGFRIPTVQEWERAYRLLKRSPEVLRFGNSCPDLMLSRPACDIWKGISVFSTSPITFSMMEEGILEWVAEGKEYYAKGAPRQEILPHLFDPENDVIRRRSLSGVRMKLYGFRLIGGCIDE